MRNTASGNEKLNTRIFKAVHARNLIYNTCWEDPALDRVALNLGPSDRLVVITSAGCNALDYLLAGPGEVNRANAAMAVAATARLGVDPVAALAAMREIRNVVGRYDVFVTGSHRTRLILANCGAAFSARTSLLHSSWAAPTYDGRRVRRCCTAPPFRSPRHRRAARA